MNSIFFIFRGDKLRRPFYFHFKINFVTDFAETEGLIQRTTIKWKQNAVNNFTRASKFLIGHSGTNNTQKTNRKIHEKMERSAQRCFLF